MRVEISRFVQIHEQVFSSKVLSKGAKLLYGAVYGLPEFVEDPRQQELDLGLPPLSVKLVAYTPRELAKYMQCGVATARKYVKELIAEGWISWHEGKSRGKDRKLVLRLDEPKKPEGMPAAVKKSVEDNAKTQELFAGVEHAAPLHPSDANASMPTQAAAEEQLPAAQDRICIPEHYVKEPLLMEDLAILEHCVNEEGNLDTQGYNRTLSAYFNHIWQTRQEHVFERAQTLIKIWLQLRRQHKKPCHGDAQYPKKTINTQPNMTM